MSSSRPHGRSPLDEAPGSPFEAPDDDVETSSSSSSPDRCADEDDNGEDLFDESRIRNDYAPNPELDHYDPTLLDDSTDTAELNIRDRRHVDRILDLRERLERGDHPPRTGAGRLTEGLQEFLIAERGDAGEDDEDEIWRILRERRERFRERADRASQLPVREAEQAKDELPYCQNQSSWTTRVAEILDVIFTGFLSYYHRPVVNASGEVDLASTSESENHVSEGTYVEKISEIVHADSTSLVIEWDDLRRYCPRVLDWIYYIPLNAISVLEHAATRITQERYPKLYQFRRVSCRIRGYTAVDSLRGLNTDHLNYFVSVRAVVVRRSNVLPKLKLVYFQCGRCQCSTNGPYEQKEGEKPKIKLVCEDCQSTGPFSICREKTLYENYQRLTVQEPPSRVVPGHVPRQKQAIVLGDLVDKVRPGDEVVITGVYQTRPDARLNATSGFPTFATQVLVNNLERRRDIQMNELTEEDLQIIHRLSKNKHIREKIIDSIAPSLWGHRLIKTGLAYAMFGGVQRFTSGNHLIRGDINFLILGDPGMGKSQFLKYVEKTFDRTVYTTGKGASAVGLTAAVRRDPTTGEWCLEGGGLVLADEGLCLIDEFDKMGDQDRVSIHEAMEQQSISISKAGIVATLRARCAVIAAANPVMGRYDSSLTFAENVDLSDPILSRFDILAVVKDTVNPIQDENLAEHVVTTHALSHPEADPRDFANPMYPADHSGNDALDSDTEDAMDVNAKWVTGPGRIPQSILKKYILYARRNCHPDVGLCDEVKLSRFYSDIRQASLVGGGIPMTVRHLESIIRMACANAKMRLAPYIERSDMDFAISTMLESFIQSQKHAVAVSLGRRFGRYRALAASPDEFLESVLVDLLSRKARELLRVRYRGRIPSSLDTEAIELMESAEVSFVEWATVVKTLYALPEIAATRFSESPRFHQRFILKSSGGPSPVATIRRKPSPGRHVET